MSASDHVTPVLNKRRPRRWLTIAALVIMALLIGVELMARFYLGLGDPPLSMTDPEIEYLFKPSRTYHRFGNVIRFNAYSMRSDDFTSTKIDPSELRVMVIGDSVVNGGVLTDQSRLATTLLGHFLAPDLHRKVVVGNISAGSWGPPNELAYLKKFGLFDADIIVLVMSSHDYADAPTFQPLVDVSPSFPGHTPWCATWEAVTRYLPQYLGRSSNEPTTPALPAQKDIDRCLAATRELIELARSKGAQVIAVQHPERDEVGGRFACGHAELKAIFVECGVPVIQLDPVFSAELAAGRNPYRDHIHPNELGQELIARQLRDAVKAIVQSAGVKEPEAGAKRE